MKSQVGQLLAQLEEQGESLDGQLKANIARRFQEEVAHVLAKKLVLAAEQYGAAAIGVVGGVSANLRIRGAIADLVAKHRLPVGEVLYPVKFVYCTDNAAMIGVAGLLDFVMGARDERA
ncbi:MAG: hypothetical protein H6765_09600 [Candidatus Peribacteria bacterium]|nr:MAG: hypothetical protein H6765_09600 [Candidatus Peribacteria bacterium]